MKTRTELQTNFYKETKTECVNSQGEFDIYYVQWLEDKVLQNQSLEQDLQKEILHKSEIQGYLNEEREKKWKSRQEIFDYLKQKHTVELSFELSETITDEINKAFEEGKKSIPTPQQHGSVSEEVMKPILDKKAHELGMVNFTNVVVSQEWDILYKCISQLISSVPSKGTVNEKDLDIILNGAFYSVEPHVNHVLQIKIQQVKKEILSLVSRNGEVEIKLYRKQGYMSAFTANENFWKLAEKQFEEKYNNTNWELPEPPTNKK